MAEMHFRLALIGAAAALALQLAPDPSADDNPLYDDLALWNTDMASVCLVNGFWTVRAPLNGPHRMIARDDGALIRISADASGQEVTYHLPRGGEVVMWAEWLIINGSGRPALEVSLEDPPELPSAGFRKGEKLDWLEARFVELVDLEAGADWHWAPQENAGNSPGFVIWNTSATAGTRTGSVRMGTGKEVDLVSAGRGVRIELCEAGGEFPHFEVIGEGPQ